ncbi:MAG: signal recognition particle protein [Armatimonadota bacterium]|nr:MAG: signal recognition particle protein [Armatimonadota bacterium]
MFDGLANKLHDILRGLRGKGRLSDEEVAAACREIRLALLEADVNFRVVREFVNRVREKAVGQEVMASLTPGQQVVKIVREELAALLGSTASDLEVDGEAVVVLMVGLQGGGKTTTAAKLARHLKGKGMRPLLTATDLRRPAAVEQLRVVGGQVGVPVFEGDGGDAVAVAQGAAARAKDEELSPVIIDTAGRTHIDEEMMGELAAMKEAVSPREVLLVLDAMTGQDAVNVAEEFDRAVGITGVILTKLDGDARGGAALSVRSVTGRPIKFAGVGEKLDALEVFHPDRMASRILGMGDVATLIEQAEAAVEDQEAAELERRLRERRFDLNDFMRELKRLGKMGSLDHLLGLIPGMQALRRQGPLEVDRKRLEQMAAIMQSMTPEERERPEIINGSRRKRIARGSGTTRQDVNVLLKQFRQMRAMLDQLAGAEEKGPTPKGMGLPGLRL